MPLVFTYGPDTLQGRMYDRIGPSEMVGTGILPGYTVVFDKPNLKDKDEGLPNLQPSEEGEVFGLLFELTPKQFEILDGFFGGYERKVLDVRVNDPDHPVTRPARTWLARRTKEGLKASPTSIELMRQGLEENAAPPPFIEALDGFEVLPMSEKHELIVGFKRGLSEADARAIVENRGAEIRRRMRTDHEDEVMLLVRTPDPLGMAKILGAHADVTHTELNQGGFSVR